MFSNDRCHMATDNYPGISIAVKLYLHFYPALEPQRGTRLGGRAVRLALRRCGALVADVGCDVGEIGGVGDGFVAAAVGPPAAGGWAGVVLVEFLGEPAFDQFADGLAGRGGVGI